MVYDMPSRKSASNSCERGDTLVEVLLSVVVLSVVIVGAITMMARGLANMQTSVGHTQVRLSIAGQTEMLRYLRDGYLQNPQGTVGQLWMSLFSGSAPYANTTQSAYGACAVTTGKRGFYLDQSSGNVVVTAFDPALQPTIIATPGRGLWIEATRSNNVAPAYVNFQLRGCWPGIGSNPQQQAVTVVRLYDPAH